MSFGGHVSIQSYQDSLPMTDCSPPEPHPTYDPEFLVDSWLAHSAAHEKAYNVQRLARYAPELGWQSILAVLELPDAQAHLGALADSLRVLISRYGSQFIDRIEAEAAISAAFRDCLAEVSPDPTFPLPEDLWPRLSAAAGVSVGPMAPHMAALYTDMPNLSGLIWWDPDPLAPDDIPILGPDDLRAQARAWVDYHQTFWAWEELNRLYEEEGLDAAWPLVLALIQKADDDGLGLLGAGTLEAILRRDGAFVIERVETEAATSSRFRVCLSHVWRGEMPSEIWDRVVTARGDEPQRG